MAALEHSAVSFRAVSGEGGGESGSVRPIRVWLVVVLLCLGGVSAAIALYPEPPVEPEPAAIEATATPPSPLQPLPIFIALDPDKVALGDALFHDTRLSGDGTISCASCHALAKAGADLMPRSIGIGGQLGEVNAPTVFNSGFNFAQFWDGRAKSLEEQVDGPLNNPKEMGTSWPAVVEKLRADPETVAAFDALYPQGITRGSIVDAIATFERSLYTPNAPFDRHLRGDATALSEQQRAGFELFVGLGCVSCHQGVGIGGNMFQRMGAKNEYFEERGTGTDADLGRFNVTGDEFDRHRFKVPSLRNVAVTPPYFHDGSAATLEEAVGVMARFQLARELAPGEREKLVAFLKSLTGEYQGRPLGQPRPAGGSG